MSDGQVLFLVLCLLYLSDCFFWIRRGTAAFVSPWGARWRAAGGTRLFGNDRGYPLFLNPLPPLDRVVLAHLAPVSISPRGVRAGTRQTLPGAEGGKRTAEALPFERIAKARADGPWLRIDGAKFARCGSPAQAREVAELIGRAAAVPENKREPLIRHWVAGRYSGKNAAAALAGADDAARPPRRMAVAFFVFLFAVAPAAAVVVGLVPTFYPLAALTVAFAVAMAVAFGFGHRSVFPGEGGDRAAHVAKMVLCPPAAIRAADALTAEAASSFSPLVVACELSADDHRAFAATFLRDLKHPLADDPADALAAEVATWYLDLERRQATKYVEKRHPRLLEEAFAPPAPEPGSASYCPRCRAQSADDAAQCPDCEGVALVPFAGGKAAGKGKADG